jgi:hypothetical protein
LKKQSNQEIPKNLWQKIVPLSDLTNTQLDELDKQYNPKIIFSAEKNSFKVLAPNDQKPQFLSKEEGQNLTVDEISEFSDYFNQPAIRMCEKFGMLPRAYRLDPRA